MGSEMCIRDSYIDSVDLVTVFTRYALYRLYTLARARGVPTSVQRASTGPDVATDDDFEDGFLRRL